MYTAMVRSKLLAEKQHKMKALAAKHKAEERKEEIKVIKNTGIAQSTDVSMDGSLLLQPQDHPDAQEEEDDESVVQKDQLGYDQYDNYEEELEDDLMENAMANELLDITDQGIGNILFMKPPPQMRSVSMRHARRGSMRQ